MSQEVGQDLSRGATCRSQSSVAFWSANLQPLGIYPEPYGTVHEPELACRHPGHADVLRLPGWQGKKIPTEDSL